ECQADPVPGALGDVAWEDGEDGVNPGDHHLWDRVSAVAVMDALDRVDRGLVMPVRHVLEGLHCQWRPGLSRAHAAPPSCGGLDTWMDSAFPSALTARSCPASPETQPTSSAVSIRASTVATSQSAPDEPAKQWMTFRPPGTWPVPWQVGHSWPVSNAA